MLIYEHELRPLDPEGEFIPLETIDTITLTAYYLKFRDVEVDNGVPSYVEAFSPVIPPNYEKRLKLGVKLFSEGRPPGLTRWTSPLDRSSGIH